MSCTIKREEIVERNCEDETYPGGYDPREISGSH